MDTMSDKSQKKTPKEDEDTEEFLKEIEEYHKKLQEKLKTDQEDTEDDESNAFHEEAEIDNLRKYIEDLKEELKIKKSKVKSLNDIVNEQRTIIENKAKTEPTRKLKCRYWNKGYCKEGAQCPFYHDKEDCESFKTRGRCEDRKCLKRHRKHCRYFNKQEGCFINETCQCLHSHKLRSKNNCHERNYKRMEISQDKCYTCDLSHFKCDNKITLKKHTNTKHRECSIEEAIRNFIYHLGLEDLSEEYKLYFYKYGFDKKETDYVEDSAG